METTETRQSTQQSSSFEQQFSKKQKLETSAGKISIVDVQPEIPTDEVPIALIPGHSETDTTHEGTLKSIFNEQRRGITINYSRFGGRTKDNLYVAQKDAKTRQALEEFADQDDPEEELKKAVALLSALDEKRILKADLIAHSEGALSALLAAELAPERFRNIVFVDPAGLIGKDNIFMLTTRFSSMLSKYGKRIVQNKNGEAPRLMKAAVEALKYSRNLPRTIGEGRAIAAADIYASLSGLQRRGTGVAIIHGVNDTVFPMEKVIETAKQKGSLDVDGFISVKGDHREISAHPEKYTTLAVNTLENLNTKKKKETA